MAIPFETEAELRIRGTAKTPDVLLSCPVGIRVHYRKNVNDKETVTAQQNDQQQQQQIQMQGEENNSTTPMQKGVSVNLLNDDDESDEYEWKIICWIDSKVRCFKCIGSMIHIFSKQHQPTHCAHRRYLETLTHIQTVYYHKLKHMCIVSVQDLSYIGK